MPADAASHSDMGTQTRPCRALAPVLAAALLAAPAAFGQSHAVPTGPDAFGYVLFDQDHPDCSFDFVDIAATGAPVAFTASGGAATLDDGGALIALQDAFELYGMAVAGVVMSTNGYLGVASALADEDGGDFSNDRSLPAIPDLGVVARLMAYHEDLSGVGTGGTAQEEHFATCRRPSGAVAGEPCTVFQWTDWGLYGGAEPFDLQALIYHRSSAIAFQIDPGAAALVAGTIGLQDARAASALQLARPGASPLAGPTAVCVFDPRFPPGGPTADLSISKTDRRVTLVPGGDTVTYTIVAQNTGPSPVWGAMVTDAFPPSLANCGWTCEASPGSSCTASGTGNIQDGQVDLLASGWATYTASCGVHPWATGVVTNTATVSPPPGVTDPDPANNSATDTDDLVEVLLIFTDGFESGDPTAWSLVVGGKLSE